MVNLADQAAFRQFPKRAWREEAGSVETAHGNLWIGRTSSGPEFSPNRPAAEGVPPLFAVQDSPFYVRYRVYFRLLERY